MKPTRNRLRRATCLALALSASATAAQSLQDESRLQERVDQFLVESNVPAVGAAVVVPGEPTLIAVAGHRTSQRQVPVTPRDLWHIGSISKSFTATLFARLIERPTELNDDDSAQRLHWDSGLGRLLPLAVGTPFENVPMRLLLAHRSGMVANPPMSRFATRDVTTPIREQRTEIVTELLGTSLEFEPGTEILYSNAGYTTAGTALEHLLDQSWEELMRREVFTPLGLDSAGFGPPGSIDVVDQPRGHGGASNDELKPVPPTPMADNPAFLGPAATIHMSLEDLATYSRAHLEGEMGIDGLVSSQSFRTLHAALEGQSHGLGWIQFPDGEGPAALIPGDVFMHNGSNTMWYAIVFFAPEERVAVAVTVNAGLHNARPVNRFAIELMQEFGASAPPEEAP